MSKPQCETTHEEALRRLCFSCAKILKTKEKHRKVEEHVQMLSNALGCSSGIEIMDGMTPSFFCNGCYLNLLKASRGETIKSSKTLLNWGECEVNCVTCAHLLKLKRGGSMKKVSQDYNFSMVL